MENKVEAYAYPEHRTKPYLYPNGRVDVEALQELERRVICLESRMNFSEVVTDVIADAPVGDNSREYYEQKIEEISAKCQTAEENLKRMTFLRDEASLEYARQMNSHSGLISTIADLREKLGSRDAIISQKNREIKSALEAQSAAEIELRNLKYPATEQYISDAKRGALVRQMPEGGYIIRLNNALHACCNAEREESKGWIKQAGEAIGA